MKSLQVAVSSLVLLLILGAGQADADLVLVDATGNLDVNVGAFDADANGMTFVGTGMNVSGFAVDPEVVTVMTDFTGAVGGQGQASINADDGNAQTSDDGFGMIMFTPTAGFMGFETFEFNPAGTGSFTITALDDSGTAFDFDLMLGPGQNRFRIDSINGQFISKVTLTANNTDSQITSIRQVRLSGLIVPEPASMMLLLSGVASAAGMSVVSRRRRSTAV